MLEQQQVDTMKNLCLKENETLWEQGDRLVAWALPDADMEKLAEIVCRKITTLRKRERIARAFPTGQRDSRHAFGVYEQLIRIPEPEARQQLVDSRSEWTIEAMERQVTDWLRRHADASGLRGPAPKIRSGMQVGNVRIKGELVGDRLRIIVEREIADPQCQDTGGELVIWGTVA